MTDETGDTEAEAGAGVSVISSPVENADSARPTGRRWSAPRMLRNVKVVPAILILLLLLSGGVTAWVYFEHHRPDQHSDPGVARAVLHVATDGTVALLSYSPDSLDKDFAKAKSYLSGDLLSRYSKFTEQIVAPAAKQKSLKTTAQVTRAALKELHPDSAVVLVFIDQSTTSNAGPDPSTAASTVLVGMARVNGNWVITKFDPI